MTVRFHPAARDELRQARLWYEERSPLSAVAFEQEVVVVAVAHHKPRPGYWALR